MKTLLSILLIAVMGCGCFLRRERAEPVFEPVPGPSTGGPRLPKPDPAVEPAAKENTRAQERARKSQAAPPDSAIVTPDASVTGKVSSYNDAGRFVVVQFPLGRTYAAGKRLSVYRNGLKVGEVKVTDQRRDVYVVADVLTGEARAGDEVRDP